MTEPFVHSEDDFQTVARQLGRTPRGRWRVARKCACGLPQVIETHPRLDDGSPFPTTWWLTCRILSKEVSRLESTGYLSRVTDRLIDDASLKEGLIESTDHLLRYRDTYDFLEEREHPGGTHHIKCLHAHVAHQLVRGDNPVGEMVLQEISWIDPSEPCV